MKSQPHKWPFARQGGSSLFVVGCFCGSIAWSLAWICLSHDSVVSWQKPLQHSVVQHSETLVVGFGTSLWANHCGRAWHSWWKFEVGLGVWGSHLSSMFFFWFMLGWHGGAAGNAHALPSEGCRIDPHVGQGHLEWSCMFFPCMNEFFLGTLASCHKPKTCSLGWLLTLNGPSVWIVVCLSMRFCDWLGISSGCTSLAQCDPERIQWCTCWMVHAYLKCNTCHPLALHINVFPCVPQKMCAINECSSCSMSGGRPTWWGGALPLIPENTLNVLKAHHMILQIIKCTLLHWFLLLCG